MRKDVENGKRTQQELEDVQDRIKERADRMRSLALKYVDNEYSNWGEIDESPAYHRDLSAKQSQVRSNFEALRQDLQSAESIVDFYNTKFGSSS